MGQPVLDAICVYGAQIMQKYLAAMAGEVEGVRHSKDIENIHRMRVASRRMRSALAIFKGCFTKTEYKSTLTEMRTVTSALGEARDIDVQIELVQSVFAEYENDPRLIPGMNRLLLRLGQRREAAQVHVNAALDSLHELNLIEELGRKLAPMVAAKDDVYIFSPALYQLAFTGVKTRLEELLLHTPYIQDPTNKQELHAMRISAKRLRYTLETFESLYGSQIKDFINTMKNLQDLLGLIHDMDVWAEFIPAFIEEERIRIGDYFGNERPLKRLLPGLEAFRESRLVMRAQAFADFTTLWGKIEKEGTWEKLVRLINTPIDLSAAMQVLNNQSQETKSQPDPTQIL